MVKKGTFDSGSTRNRQQTDESAARLYDTTQVHKFIMHAVSKVSGFTGFGWLVGWAKGRRMG